MPQTMKQVAFDFETRFDALTGTVRAGKRQTTTRGVYQRVMSPALYRKLLAAARKKLQLGGNSTALPATPRVYLMLEAYLTRLHAALDYEKRVAVAEAELARLQEQLAEAELARLQEPTPSVAGTPSVVPTGSAAVPARPRPRPSVAGRKRSVPPRAPRRARRSSRTRR
jgi:hypothetical protein